LIFNIRQNGRFISLYAHMRSILTDLTLMSSSMADYKLHHVGACQIAYVNQTFLLLAKSYGKINYRVMYFHLYVQNARLWQYVAMFRL